jgi:CubicO group peptidase (beta-lactamase class C family)
MFRSPHIWPIAPAEDAISRWLAFHAYWLAVGVFVQRRTAEDVIRDDLSSNGVLGERSGGQDPTAPLTWRDISVSVDVPAQAVTLSAPDGSARTAGYRGRYGCVMFPEGTTSLALPDPGGQRSKPQDITTGSTWAWPYGDGIDRDALPSNVDLDVIDAAAKDVTSDGLGRAFVVIHDGRLIAESYATPFSKSFRHAGWSMTKSLVGALVGRLIQQGHLSLETPAPVTAWQSPNDQRSKITVDNLLRMSSGLDCPYGLTPWAHGDKHFRVCSGLTDVYGFVSSLPSRAAAGTRCAYQNCDVIAMADVVRHITMEQGVPFVEAPYELLFAPLGMDSMVLHADSCGNFIMSGFSTATVLDWARLGQLYLNDGMWEGDRLLPPGWLDYALTPAPADDEPVYGGALLWLGHRVLGERLFGRHPLAERLPPTAMAAGHYGQRTLIIPSHSLVIVRMGHGHDDDLLLNSVHRIIEELSR